MLGWRLHRARRIACAPQPTGLLPVRRRLFTALTLGLIVLGALLPAGAPASSIDLQRDCIADGRIDGTYSQKDYRDALRSLSTSSDEYTNCRGITEPARLAAAGATPATPGSVVPIPVPGVDPLAAATPAQRAAVKIAQTSPPAALVIGGETVRPGTIGAGRAVKASVSDIPAPLLITIALAVLAGLGALASIAIPRVRRRSDS